MTTYILMWSADVSWDRTSKSLTDRSVLQTQTYQF